MKGRPGYDEVRDGYVELPTDGLARALELLDFLADGKRAGGLGELVRQGNRHAEGALTAYQHAADILWREFVCSNCDCVDPTCGETDCECPCHGAC